MGGSNSLFSLEDLKEFEVPPKFTLSSAYVHNCTQDELLNMFMEAVTIGNSEVVEAFLEIDIWPKAMLNRSTLLFGKHSIPQCGTVSPFLYAIENYSSEALQNLLSVVMRTGTPSIESIFANREVVIEGIERIFKNHDDDELTSQVISIFMPLFHVKEFGSKCSVESLKNRHFCSLRTLMDVGVYLPRKFEGELLINFLMMFDLDENVIDLLKRNEMRDRLLQDSPEGYTPLHFAVSFGNEPMVSFVTQEQGIPVPEELIDSLEEQNALWRQYGQLKKLIRQQNVELIAAELTAYQDLCTYVDLAEFCILWWIDHYCWNEDIYENLLKQFTFVYEDFIWGLLLNNCSDRGFILKALKAQDQNLKLIICQGRQSQDSILSRLSNQTCTTIVSFSTRHSLANVLQEQAKSGKGLHVFQRRNRNHIFKEFVPASKGDVESND
jgi:hypothetical protein